MIKIKEIESEIEEINDSGIGASHWATYHTNRIERDFLENITDVSVW